LQFHLWHCDCTTDGVNAAGARPNLSQATPKFREEVGRARAPAIPSDDRQRTSFENEEVTVAERWNSNGRAPNSGAVAGHAMQRPGDNFMAKANALFPPEATNGRDETALNLVPATSVLVVTTEISARKFLSDILRTPSFRCTITTSGTASLSHLQRQRVDAVIADVHTACMSGLKFLADVRHAYPKVAFLAVTGADDSDVGAQAIRYGADDCIVRPFRQGAVLAILARAIQKRQLENQIENYSLQLEEMVMERTAQLRESLFQVQRGYETTVQAFGEAIDSADSEAPGHCQRVCQYSLEIARLIGLSKNEQTTLVRGAYLHDIGKLGIPERILRKSGFLTEDERKLMQLHPSIGFNLVKDISLLSDTAELVFTHHERHDGGGYPRGLKGDEIPLTARIFALADALDSITSHRSYRPAASFESALDSIRRLAGQQFDPQFTKVFLSVPKATWRAIARGNRPGTDSLTEANSSWDFHPSEMPYKAPEIRDLRERSMPKIKRHGKG
jgi:cyclic di-GMP phosphodiesterase